MALKRNSKLINKKFIQYLIPSILMIFAMQFGSLVDGILIGNFIGSDALSASSLVLPILFVVQIPGFALGIGGSIVVANLLGKRDIESSKKVFSISIVVGMAISFLFMALSFFVSRPLAQLFADSLVDYSTDYIFMYLLTDPVITFALLIGSFMAVDNNPRLSSIFYIVSNIAKVGLEILFIQVFHWGMKGAALSTAAGYFVGLITIIFYIKSKERSLSFSFKLKNNRFKEVFKASSASALNLLLTAIQMFVVNIVIGQVLTNERDLLIYGLVANMIFVFDLFCGGVLNLIQNICAIFYGEKDYFSVKSVAKKIYFINIAITIAISIFIVALPNVYSLIFGYNDMENFDYVAMILRIYLISFIPYEINKFSMNYYPTIDKTMPSIITVLLRELVIVLPVTLTLLYTNGLLGYAYSAIITEASTVIITYIFIFIYQKVKKTNTSGIFMLEKVKYDDTFDVSINDELSNASVVSEEITKFLLKHEIPNRESQLIGLASEEIVSNIITYGYKKIGRNYIDVSVKKVDNTLILTIRDDGMPFDPTKYEFDNDENYSTSGINLIKNLTDKLSYMRILNLNNTIFELNINGGTTSGNQN